MRRGVCPLPSLLRQHHLGAEKTPFRLMFFKVSPLSLALTQVKKKKKKIRGFQRPPSSRGTEQEGDTQQERVSSREEGGEAA